MHCGVRGVHGGVDVEVEPRRLTRWEWERETGERRVSPFSRLEPSRAV